MILELSLNESSLLTAAFISAGVFVGLTVFVVTIIFNSHNQKLKHRMNVYKAIVATQEKERNIISKELHDNIGAMLSLVNLRLSLLDEDTEKKYEDSIRTLTNTISSCLADLRFSIQTLAPKKISDNGWVFELQEFVRLANSATIKFKIQEPEISMRFSQSTELNLYRIMQELVHNALKHSAASIVDILISIKEEKLCIRYMDDGKGFSYGKLKNHEGFGIKNIENRVKMLKGIFSFEPLPVPGTYIQFEFRTAELMLSQ